VAQSRKDFQASLPEFQRQNPALFPKIAVEEIRRTFGVYGESIDHTLETHNNRAQNRAKMDQNFARIITLIDHEIRPLIRNEQMDQQARSEGILNVENQARAWQQNLAKAWTQPSHSA